MSTPRFCLAITLACLVLFTGTAPDARADFIPSLNFTSGNTGFFNGPGTLGSVFTVGPSAITIDAFGMENVSIPPGNTVRIYQFGTTTDLATQVVTGSDPISTTDPRYHYHTLATPLVLTANTQYVILMDINNQNVTFLDTGITSDPRITFNSSVESVGATGAHPTTDQQAFGPYFGPTFEIQAASAAPEPTSLSLLAIGTAGLLGFSWRRRKATVPVA
jgi:PEP-CTERM motif